MKRFEYQIVVQWDGRRNMYEAYSPTMFTFAAKFLPNSARTIHKLSMAKAVWYAADQVKTLLSEVRALGIIPPPPDIGFSDPIDYISEVDKGKKTLYA